MVSAGEFVTEDRGAFASVERGFLPRLARIPVGEAGEAEVRVSEGDVLSEGQVVARSPGADVHSPVPGVVVSVGRGRYCGGMPGTIVSVRTGGRFAYTGRRPAASDWTGMTPGEIAGRMRSCGVVDTFFGCRPLFPMLSGGPRAVVVRLFDEDPSRALESFVAERMSERVLSGAGLVAKASGASLVVLAYDRSSAESRRLFREYDGGGELLGVPAVALAVDGRGYPSGTMVDLVRAASSAKVRARGGFPSEILASLSQDDVFIDSPCALAAFEAVSLGIPVMSRVVHVGGGALGASGILRVKVGTTLAELAEHCGGFKRGPARVAVNGTVLGRSVPSLEIPVSKFVKSVSFFAEGERESRAQRATPCIRCGACRKICPVGLWPGNVHRVLRNVQEAAGRVGPDEAAVLSAAAACDGCSLCSAVCPSRLPLARSVAMAAAFGGGDGQD